jgi:hypothetical protein
MNRDELRRLLRRQPFQPFRVLLNDGRTYEVRHPYMNLLADSYIKIGIPDQTRPELCDHTEYVRFEQIAHTEPLPATPPLAP